MSTKSLMSIAELSQEYGLDVSYISKLVKKLKLIAVPAISKEGRACKALTDKDIEKLEKEIPTLKAIEFNEEKYITLADMAEELDRDSSGLHKAIRNAGFEFTYCRVLTERTRNIKREGQKAIKETVICSGRPTPCLTKTEFERFKTKYNRVQLG